MDQVDTKRRPAFSALLVPAAVGITVFLATFRLGCDDIDGVSDWERCDSVLLNPIVDWPGVIAYLAPLALGVGLGLLVGWLIRRSTKTAVVTRTVALAAIVVAWLPFVRSIFTQ